MEKGKNSKSRRSQKDYSMAFKLTVISDVEKGNLTYKQAQTQYGIQGKSTVLVWLRKHGNLDWEKPHRHLYLSKMKETPAQKIKRLERQLADEKLKTKILNGMIEYADENLGTSIRKKLRNCPPLHDGSKYFF
jgi:transposase-like protein